MTMTMPGRDVLVGLGDALDGAPELDWAAREADMRGCALRVVRVPDPTGLLLPWESRTDRLIKSDLRRVAETRLRWGALYLQNKWPGVRVDPEVVEGPVSHVLLEAGAGAALTVLGSRRLGGIGSTLLGSVGAAVVARAHAPVVVVRGPEGDPERGPAVVAGADGSPAMHDVMAFAFDYASRHRRPLRVVSCHNFDVIATSPWRTSAPSRERAEYWLAEVTAGWQEKYPDVEVQRMIKSEHPVRALVNESRGQDLLVVGHHARRTRMSGLFGSVSQGVLHHATCPVAVIQVNADA